MHNYPAGNSYKVKLSNWQTLKSNLNSKSDKVLVKLGINLTEDDCSRLANATPMAIEAVLFEVKRVIDDAIMLYEHESSPQKGTSQSFTQNRKQQDEFSVSTEIRKVPIQSGSSKAE